MKLPYQMFHLLALAILALSSFAPAQEVRQITASEAASHLLKSSPPQYPGLASVAHIQGKVLLEITIAVDGKVAQVHAISGHPMLLESAMRAVKSWKYSPFLLDGTPVTVQSRVRFLFSMGSEASAEQKYFVQEGGCVDLLQVERFDEADKLCSAALQTARGLKTDAFGFRMNAYGNAGQAAYHLNRVPEAMHDFQDRFELARKDLQPEDPAWVDLHADMARVLQAAGALDQSELEYKETEKVLDDQAKALSKERDHGPAVEYVLRRRKQMRDQWRETFAEHAALLRKMGRNAEADDLDQRAKSLVPGN